MKTKFITCIYSDLHGTEFGGRPSRKEHYRWSLLSLLKMNEADFVCYTSQNEYNDLCDFFYVLNHISKEKLDIKVFELKNSPYQELFSKYKNINEIISGDRCLEIQYMKLNWFLFEDGSYDYYFWIDAGLSHCGIIPNKYLPLLGTQYRGYFESNLFRNNLLYNLINFAEDKFVLIGKENIRNYWSATVNNSHYFEYDNSIHIIGGLFGGKKELWLPMIDMFTKYLNDVANCDNKLYHEEQIFSLMYRNHMSLFKLLYFEIWWHEDERIPNFDIISHTKANKSFYKILEELNG